MLACGGLIGPNGAVNLLRTTTLAGYHDGEEHYVTAFQFAGGGGAFGSLTPLPGVPSKVEKGGDWTLQRLVRETEPRARIRLFRRRRRAAAARPRCSWRSASTRSTSRSCGAAPTRSAAGRRTTASGSRRMRPRCSSSTPSGRRSSSRRCSTRTRPRSAARRSATARRSTSRSRPTTRGSRCGSSRLGKTGEERVEADVYLLNDQRPALLPAPTGDNGLTLLNDEPASESLLADLHSDRGMGWVPSSAWLTKVRIDASASQLAFDLAIDASGAGAPSYVDAGLVVPSPGLTSNEALRLILGLGMIVVGVGGLLLLVRWRPSSVAA